MHDNLLRAAFARLDLAPGASWSEILTRYRQLAKVWHPDRFKTKFDKEKAEEKLKLIIAAKEILQAHYQSEAHSQKASCICWARPAASPAPAPPSSSQSKSPPPADSAAANTRKAKVADAPPAWIDELCKNLDIGPMAPGEPAWFETFRRFCDNILGKHPGDTLMDIWEKAPTWTRDHKRKSFLIVLFIVAMADKIVAAASPDNLTPEEKKSHAQSAAPSRPQQSPLSPASAHDASYGPPINLDSADEIRSEQRYFDQKWQEQNRLLQRIRPGYSP